MEGFAAATVSDTVPSPRPFSHLPSASATVLIEAKGHDDDVHEDVEERIRSQSAMAA